MEKAGSNTVEWESLFHQLQDFKRRHGHCNVPRNWPPDPGLARWVGLQRSNPGRLSLAQAEGLHRMGFDFGASQNQWFDRYFELVRFHRKHGHCNVPQNWPENRPLGKWVQNLRARRRAVSLDRVAQLNTLGFVWKRMEAVWETRFNELKQFKARFGHCRVPQLWAKNGKLAHWVQHLRRIRDQLSRAVRKRLDDMGFDWNPNRARWEKQFDDLVSFKREHGHCNVTRDHPGYPHLGAWLMFQRSRRSKGRLDPEDEKRLDELGMEWNPVQNQWETKFAQLVAFKKKHGHCNVPDNFSEIPGLGAWVYWQRKYDRRLLPDRRRRLDALGFRWELHQPLAWEQRFSELAAFKKRFGHCNVPFGWRENPRLGRWVNAQKNPNRWTTPERRKRLDALGFVWNLRNDRWEKHFAELAAFKRRYGHCNVPQQWPANPKLGHWLAKQRNGKGMTPARWKRLDDLGVCWKPTGDRWETRFREVAAFKKKFGHCNIPQRCPVNLALGPWLNFQRKRRWQMFPDLRRKLDRLGLDWNPRNTAWERRYRELLEYRKKHGHCNVPGKVGDHASLGNWVSFQRANRCHLSPERRKRLQQVGFQWSLRQVKTCK
ncbi:MAG: helicase associated domain-containing protein [Verrucomicrobia bacterium]|nr:helicase associated domain-containing protein [Verrucomicrobiota bacterium]